MSSKSTATVSALKWCNMRLTSVILQGLMVPTWYSPTQNTFMSSLFLWKKIFKKYLLFCSTGLIVFDSSLSPSLFPVLKMMNLFW